MRETDDNEDEGSSLGEKTTNTRDVLDAFDTIRTFLGMPDDDVAMD